jgi:hypothetical protein
MASRFFWNDSETQSTPLSVRVVRGYLFIRAFRPISLLGYSRIHEPSSSIPAVHTNSSYFSESVGYVLTVI